MLMYDIANYAIEERTRPLPAEVIHHAKRAVIDWCAATAQGSVIMPAAGLIKAFTEDVGRGEARLFPSGIPATLRAAAIINGAASHTVEFDDIFRDALYHPGASVISTALAAAEAEALSGEEFLRAIIVGYEISTRIALVMGRAHYKYWHSTATNGSFGAAAAAASVFKLDRDQFANAIALAGTMAAGLQQSLRYDSHAKPMHAAHVADSGVLSAQAAAQGVKGALDILEGEVGFGMAMSKDCDWSIAVAGLGEDYNISRITFKNYGCCGHAFAAIDGALALRDRHSIDPSGIENIRVDGYSATVNICGNNKHTTANEGKFSVPYLVATALTHGGASLEAFTEARLTDPNTTALAAKVDVRLDHGIDAEFPSRRAARVNIKMRDGRFFEHYQPTRRGDPDSPLSNDELDNKFMELTRPVMGEKASVNLLEVCRSLDSLGSMREFPMGSALEAV